MNIQTNNKKGAALLISLGVIIILSLVVGSLALEMNVESMLISNKRKIFRSEILARSGIEYAKAIIEQQNRANQLEIMDVDSDEIEFLKNSLYVKRGLSIASALTITNMGSINFTIKSAEDGRNINLLDRSQWIEIFEMANIPSTEWDYLIDSLKDWIDEGDTHRLNGAESDDPYYQEKGYPVRNGPLESIEELLLIKYWNEDFLYGKQADEESDSIYGISDLLTVWGDGKVNLNTATTNVLLSYAEYEDWELESVLNIRNGLDGIPNTLDDGIKSIEDVNADPNKFKLYSNFLKVSSVGKCGNKEFEIKCIMHVDGARPSIVYWNEGLKN